MKKVFLSILLMMPSILGLFAAKKAAVNINRIEPTDWYAGMKNQTLQLMVSGQGIREAEVTVDYQNVTVDSLVRLDSPNYLFVYLNLNGATAGNMPVTFKLGKRSCVVNYELKQREMTGSERKGFDINDILYMLMPDRFSQGHADNSKVKTRYPYVIDRTAPSLRHGGDIEGIRQHLDYFKDLGVTTLWFTPVLENDMPEDKTVSTYHGYATTDYYKVDPRFGSNAEYRKLVDEAHCKGLKIVMDMIFNHCGSSHPWMQDAPSKDWFNNPNYGLQTSYKLTPTVDPYASEVDKTETVDGWFVATMPDLNQRNTHLMTYLIQNSEWWIETMGIDGIRMDTYPYADFDGMARWMKTINEEYPNFNVVGESWVTEPAFTATLQKDCKFAEKNSYLNTVMDFAFFDRMSQAKGEETNDQFDGLQKIYNVFVYDYLYANPKSVMAFLENHDTDRFLGTGKDIKALKQGLALLMTVNRIPQLYYGTEVLMNGVKKITDGYVREDFPGGFPGDKHNAFTREGRTAEQNEIFDWLSALLHWRQNNPLIAKGKMTQFLPYNGVYVVAHQYDGKTTMTILNGTSKDAKCAVKRYAEIIGNSTTARNVITGKAVNLSSDISLAPRDALIIEF
jgi:neopullulanase